mmetsp:Transcript_22734/g.37614  ORF Transcript_22734/g.37614 Transcript_22734/m.37614 type:complete len:250 (-) Transcript_22734:281-1030(-)
MAGVSGPQRWAAPAMYRSDAVTYLPLHSPSSASSHSAGFLSTRPAVAAQCSSPLSPLNFAESTATSMIPSRSVAACSSAVPPNGRHNRGRDPLGAYSSPFPMSSALVGSFSTDAPSSVDGGSRAASSNAGSSSRAREPVAPSQSSRTSTIGEVLTTWKSSLVARELRGLSNMVRRAEAAAAAFASFSAMRAASTAALADASAARSSGLFRSSSSSSLCALFALASAFVRAFWSLTRSFGLLCSNAARFE